MLHSQSQSIHRARYVQTADPGAVGTGVEWLDTNTSPPVHKVRNAADDGWDTISLPGSGGLVAVPFIIDGGGDAITPGVKGFVEIPFDGTIQSARLLADQSGDIVIDLWKDTYANYPPTVANTITASAKPTLSSAAKAEDTTLTGWTADVSAGDIIGVNVDSASTVTRVTLSLVIQRT